MKKITLILYLFFTYSMTSYAGQIHQNLSDFHNTYELVNSSNTNNTNEDILSISFTDDYITNTSSITNNAQVNDYLYWVHNGSNLNQLTQPVTINLSSDINSDISTTVSYTTLQRIWKIIPLSNTTITVNLKIPKDAINHNSTAGQYYMFISHSPIFDSDVDYKILTSDGTNNLETEYRFDRNTYITFGFSPQITEKRSVYFNGTESYIDLKDHINLNSTGFTISTWIKHQSVNAEIRSILSKRDVAFTQGFDLRLTANNKIEMLCAQQELQSLTSNTTVPENQWHHIAITYDGTKASLYIDGVLDTSASLEAPIPTNESFYIAAAGSNTPTQYFKGHIDEVRLWKTALTKEQLRFIMNQEITEHAGFVIGKELPLSITKNTINTIPWTDLVAYYPMSEFTFRNTIDASKNQNNGDLKHLRTIDKQTAPLPYKSIQDGNWDAFETWSNNAILYIPGAASIVDSSKTIDWNIVRTSHLISMENESLPNLNNNRTFLGLFVDDNELTLSGETTLHTGNAITITHHLGLTGKIDLQGESQLIQTLKSDLEIASTGYIERDQQGTADTYTYNYWSSPVKRQNSSSNHFKVTDVMKDGTDPYHPVDINFISSGFNGANTHPIQIADYWIWKYSNLPSNSYTAWQHIRRTGSILPGEGFTMKGPGTGSVSTPQNYVFRGTPNNGDIQLELFPNNDYLVGNPYPSAIDAIQFIKDNGPQPLNHENSPSYTSPLISGTLYFWNHWGGNSHVLQDYQGGYATYNYSGGVAAAYKANNFPTLETDGEPTKVPGRYIPVAQGFFVQGINSGTINFNNGQRVFKKEGNASEFMRSTNTTSYPITTFQDHEDNRFKLRLGFKSVNTIHRQLLLTIDENTTTDVDWAYDGALFEEQIDDMYWLIQDDPYIIQASNKTDVATVYPLGIHTQTAGINTIGIDALENVPENLNIYLRDNTLNLYHNLNTGDYNVFLNSGEHLERFQITFGTDDTLNITDETIQDINIVFNNDSKHLIIINPQQIELKSMTIFNLLGQSIHQYNSFKPSNYSEYKINNLSVGTYIIKIQTHNGSQYTKKIIVF